MRFKQIAKACHDPVTTFAWEFSIALATLKYRSPDEQLGAVKLQTVHPQLGAVGEETLSLCALTATCSSTLQHCVVSILLMMLTFYFHLSVLCNRPFIFIIVAMRSSLPVVC